MTQFWLIAVLSASVASAADVEVFHAHEIQPVRPAQQLGAMSNAPASGRTNVPVGGSMEMYHAGSVKLNRPGGVDAVAKPSALDGNVVGTWVLAIPGVAYQSEQDRGSYTERTLHAGPGAIFGVLAISEDGTFTWQKNGVSERGRLEQVLPRNTADPRFTYWRLHHGGQSFYVFAPRPDQLSVYSAVESAVAYGKRAR